MSIIKDIADAIGALKDGVRGVRGDLRQNMQVNGKDVFDAPIRSVAAKARRSILYFPLVCSESVSPETSGLLMRLVQTRAAVYTRLTISMDDVIDVTGKEGSKADLVRSIRGGSSLRDALVDESAQAVNAYLRSQDGQRLVELGAVAADAILNSPLEEAGKGKNAGMSVRQQQKARSAGISQASDGGSPGSAGATDVNGASGSGPSGTAESEDDWAEDAREKLVPGARAQGSRRKVSDEDKKTIEAYRKARPNSRLEDDEVLDEIGRTRKVGYAQSKMESKDIELLNKERPLILELTVQYRTEAGLSETTLLIAIKAVVHAIPAGDMITGVGGALAGDSLVFQFLRATSGETSFLSDFLLNIEGARKAVASQTTGARMLETLKRQAAWNRRARNWIVRAFVDRKQVPPTATLTITQDEADTVKSLYGVDLDKPAHARDFLDTHNLMGFMIVNEPLRMVKVFEDGADDYERVPFSELMEKGKDNTVREVLQALGRS